MTLISLPYYKVLVVQGKDARNFLQGQLTCDVEKLSLGQSTLAAHCDPKGKMTALFYLIADQSDRFLLLIQESLLPIGLAQLKKYAIFSQVTFELMDWQVVGGYGDNQGEKNLAFSSTVWLSEQRFIGINPLNIQTTISSDTAYWQVLDIQEGIPLLSDGSQGEFIPQALNIQHIKNALSFQKGCYIGQETIARAKYRGINKREMQTFYVDNFASSLPTLGSEIEIQLENGWRKTGFVLSAVIFNGSLWIQVVLNHTEEQTCYRLLSGETLVPYTVRYPDKTE